MKKSISVLLLAVLICSALLSGCSGKNHGLNPNNPVTLTMWHNFGGEMQHTMDELIDEFNSTVGKEQGIIINVTSISSSSDLQENLNMIINGDPGAPAMPDITTCYPKTAVIFKEKGLIASLDSYFTEDELSAYIPQFMEEGRLDDGKLYVFPFAKSTEILYLNQTFFDKFSKATGITMENLSTFEGISEAALAYYSWTDGLTPDISDDGKAFFAADSWLNLAQAGMKQQNTELFVDEKPALTNDAFEKIWDCLYAPSVQGGFAIYDGYSSDLSKTGDLVCSTGSSAGILFYGDTITYPDNTIEQVEFTILPFPVFENGKKVAIQRGNGLCVAKSNETREYAASVFLKWFTEPKQNLNFIFATGYLPVTNEAFTTGMPALTQNAPDERIAQMLAAVTEMYHTYDFFVAPAFPEFDSLGKQYEQNLKQLLSSEQEFLRTSGAFSSEMEPTDINQLSKDSLDVFRRSF